MKKAVVLILAMFLTITLFTVTPARANRFWPGVAIGVGSAIVLGSLLYSPRAYYPDSRPVRVYGPPAYYGPPPPVYRESWIPGHWVERVGPYGHYERFWIPGHRERLY
jgi:hypothetical protein